MTHAMPNHADDPCPKCGNQLDHYNGFPYRGYPTEYEQIARCPICSHEELRT